MFCLKLPGSSTVTFAVISNTVNVIAILPCGTDRKPVFSDALEPWGTVQPFLDVRMAVLRDTLEDAFRHHDPGFQHASDDH